MALELGYSLRQVERALIELEQMKVIIKSKHREDSRMVVYHINPYQSWKGDIADRKKRIAEHNPNQLKLPMFGIDEKNQKQLPNNTDFLNM
jgi:transcription initiation factor IIE alpha subunit